MKRPESFQAEDCNLSQDDRLRMALQRLPTVQPPMDVWDALNARFSRKQNEASENQATGSHQPSLTLPENPFWKRASVIRLRHSLPAYATVASVFLIVLSVILIGRPLPSFQDQELESGRIEPTHTSTGSSRTNDVAELLNRSQRLENTLRRTRPDEFVWNTTRQALVYRISDVDRRLNQMGVQSHQYSPEYKVLLQRRLALMDSLLQVQQSPRVTVF